MRQIPVAQVAEVGKLQAKPWAPIFSVERSEHEEVLVEGIVSIVAGTADGHVRSILAIGDDQIPIWTRSLLKPWQLLANLPLLQEAYPQLLPQHLAVMASSHSADLEHLCALRQIIDLGGVAEGDLRCPAAMPKALGLRQKFERDGEKARPLFHNCSGKHLGYLLAIKAQNLKTENYLDPSGPHHRPLLSVLARLTGRPVESFVPTVDGCRMPNYSLTAFETAALYTGLLSRAYLPLFQRDNSDLMDRLLYIGGLMNTYPEIIDGQHTLDSEIMKGCFRKKDMQTKFVAKFGADGLLAVGLDRSDKYPYGAGILIKLAHGMSAGHLEIIFREVMRQMSFRDDTVDGIKTDDHVKTSFFFRLPA